MLLFSYLIIASYLDPNYTLKLGKVFPQFKDNFKSNATLVKLLSLMMKEFKVRTRFSFIYKSKKSFIFQIRGAENDEPCDPGTLSQHAQTRVLAAHLSVDPFSSGARMSRRLRRELSDSSNSSKPGENDGDIATALENVRISFINFMYRF